MQKITDNITFSSEGPDCYSDDKNECLPSTTSDSADDIITTTVAMTKLSSPKPETKDKGNHTCKNKDCKPQATELASQSKNTTAHIPSGHTISSSNGTTTGLTEPGAKMSSSDSGHLNIFLIIGIACGVLVALIIV